MIHTMSSRRVRVGEVYADVLLARMRSYVVKNIPSPSRSFEV